MEQLQFLQHESPLKEEKSTPELTILSRRQAELEAANDRLQHTAQNFSLEWKTFFGYAMKIKQQRTTDVSTSSIASEKDLEDILLKTQGGLVLLRELHDRRHHQWKEVAKRYGYQHEAITDNVLNKHDSDRPSQPQWFQTLVSKLSKLNQQVAATAHCAVKRSQLVASRDRTQGMLKHQPSLLKQRAHALDTCHRLQHVLDSSADNDPPSTITDCVRVEDVNMLMQFNYMKHQQAVVLERFCIRLKWLPVSHRFHLRQRMLALSHQQKAKNTPRSNASTAYRNSKNHLQCPLFMISTAHFAAELKVLALKYALSIPDGVDVKNKSSTEEFHTFRQGADGLLASVVGTFPSDNAINSDANVEMNLDPLVHSYTGNSRWEMIQRGFLGNCEPGQERTEETLITLRNNHKIDSLLANEWELLSLDDLEYLRARLEALSRAHMNRAQVDIAVTGSVLENKHLDQAIEEAIDDDDQSNEDGQRNLSSSWNPDALYSLYVLRVASCRAKRLSLLRLLNYLHFVQLSQVNSLSNSSSGGRSSKSAEGSRINPWIATKCEKTGDYIVICSPNTEDDNIDDNTDNKGNPEFTFAAARRDLEVLELQMLRMASIFIFKQEYNSLPSPRKHTNDRCVNDHDSDSIVMTIDRLEVLRDIYDCEVVFHQAKVQLVENLLEIGLQFAPRMQDVIELGFVAPEMEAEPFTDILLPLLQRRPNIDFSHAYFFESYATETILLELQTSLIQQIEQYFERLEWCALQDFAFGEHDDNDNDRRQWVCRQILGKRSLIQLYSHQNELVRVADEKWFSCTSVGEFHALQHALLEQTLVTWSLIIKLELPGRSMRCLERTSGDLLIGNGWQLVLRPQLLSDICQTLHEQTNEPRPLIEYLHKSVELENWRHSLGKSVYEAHLLERIHHFHFDFVKYAAALDSVLGGEQARHLAFFFDFGECDRTRSLQPFAMELEMATSHTSNTMSASRPTCLHSDDKRPISEWLHAHLSSSQRLVEDFGKSDDVDKQLKKIGTWRRSLSQLQQQYVSYLRVNVSYQDAVGADVFEFAASYPYVCLANTLIPESSDLSDGVSMDFNTVRTKYAKEIADKMAEEMRTSCFPYWKKLENLKQQLHERFATTQDQNHSTIQPEFQLQDMLVENF
ncbi:LOW QUALITY PROTEIN: Hypothetical protein PHPALM_762 [Phytophthora palmivora]|uniref:Uncharacterized protein n=1 Tax=Phytophthora palmivora TaxID=4796 RepID=A0A2P4YU10_9STRA|nr:LOW QUALITY PROTEIN: Hypothetical protein PHPALM_762 [Phytophthora palmivora]